jgi:hypothetical protein
MKRLPLSAKGNSYFNRCLPAAIGRLRLGQSLIHWGCGIVFWAVAIVIFMCGQAAATNEIVIGSGEHVPFYESEEAGDNFLRATYQGDFWATTEQPCHIWTIDYRFRSLVSSYTSYEFGLPTEDGWTPLSRLNFDLNSLWHGVQVGFQRPLWGIHCEWLTPMQRNIDGYLNDYDWMLPDGVFTDRGIAKERWNDGQMLDLEGEFRIWDEPFGLPMDVWLNLGFRWQRFDLTAYDALQVKEDDVYPPNPAFYAGDVLTFNQQYYIGYVGGQIRSTLVFPWIPSIDITFQGDWGAVGANNVDHHLIREGDRYTMENTCGDSFHLGLTAEVPIKKYLSMGLQADYLQIQTHGTHRLYNEPEDTNEAWSYGVRAWSEQTWFTAFVRLRI